MDQKLIKYRHKDDNDAEPTFFVALEEDPIPEWAADVQEHTIPVVSYTETDFLYDDFIFSMNSDGVS